MASAELPLRYAGFWRRYVAYGIDSILVLVLTCLLIWLLGDVANAQDAMNADAYRILVEKGWLPAPQPGQTIEDVLRQSGASGAGGIAGSSLLIGLIVSGIYNIWFTAGGWQATPGKRWCGLLVIRTNGVRIGYPMSCIRWFASGISWLPLGFGYFMVGLTREKTAMHDVICGTRVVYRAS